MTREEHLLTILAEECAEVSLGLEVGAISAATLLWVVVAVNPRAGSGGWL